MNSMLRWTLCAVLNGSLALTAQVGTQNQPLGGSRSGGVKGTVEGLVRDIACPIQNLESSASEFNLECALQCARKGSPLIILTKDGTMYVPISASMPDVSQRERLKPFIGKHVRVTGILYDRAGTHAVAVKDVETLPEK